MEGWDLGQNLSPGEETWRLVGAVLSATRTPSGPGGTPLPPPRVSHSSAPALLLVLGFITCPLCSWPEAEATCSDSSLGPIPCIPN